MSADDVVEDVIGSKLASDNPTFSCFNRRCVDGEQGPRV